jgi:hypothetical protein
MDPYALPIPGLNPFQTAVVNRTRQPDLQLKHECLRQVVLAEERGRGQ